MPTISWQQKFSTKNEKSVRKTNESTNMVAAQRSVNPYKSIFITNIHQKCQTFIHYFIFFSALFHIFRCLIASFYFLSFAYKFFTATPLFPYTVYRYLYVLWLFFALTGVFIALLMLYQTYCIYFHYRYSLYTFIRFVSIFVVGAFQSVYSVGNHWAALTPQAVDLLSQKPTVAPHIFMPSYWKFLQHVFRVAKEASANIATYAQL